MHTGVYFILFYFILFYFILHPLRLLGACVFLQQTLFFLSWLVHDHLLGFTPASQIHLCPCLLCDYLGSVPTPPKIAQKNSDGKIHPLSLVNLMLPDLLRNIFCLLEINFKFLNNIFHCHGAVYMFYIKWLYFSGLLLLGLNTIDCKQKYMSLTIDQIDIITTLKKTVGASLVAQWLRICLPMQGTRVRAPVWEDPTCRGATGPVSHNYWACASGACAPQRERPPQWEARAPWWRVAPACHN